jgi:ribonuclease III
MRSSVGLHSAGCLKVFCQHSIPWGRLASCQTRFRFTLQNSAYPSPLVSLDVMRPSSIEQIVKRYSGTGICDTPKESLETALTHDSAIRSTHQRQQRERLEFLGDSVISLTVADMLLKRYPHGSEGFLTRARIRLVNGCMQAELCRICGLSDLLQVGPDAEYARHHRKVLEDSFEAFVGALFCQVGPTVADQWVRGVITSHIGDWEALIRGTQTTANPNPKACLLARYPGASFRELNVSCPAGSKSRVFTVSARDAQDRVLAIGRGSTRKAAEIAAARHALQMC